MCNPRTGQCHCRPSVVGRRCDKCPEGYWNIDSAAGMSIYWFTERFVRLKFSIILGASLPPPYKHCCNLYLLTDSLTSVINYYLFICYVNGTKVHEK